jgi:uncharacterized protein YecE (DUF72 family)
MAGQVHIGCSGWSYKDWRGPFYPEKLAAKGWFGFYASQFDTTELNASFYRLPAEQTVRGWAEKSPAGFVWAWKASRFITHQKRLKDCEESLELVLGRMAPLGHAGPVLFQLPPSMKRDDDRLAGFLKLLPKARRFAFEFRHPSWYDGAIFRQLKDANASLCLSDHHHAPAPWEVTADFVYLRGHGPGGRYFGRYDDEALHAWARSIRAWRDEGRAVFGYFDNDIKSAAPADARRLTELVRSSNGPKGGMGDVEN